MPDTVSHEDELLESWRVKISGWRWLHYHAMHHYKKINARFTYTSIALSTLAGAGGFSTAGSGGDASENETMKLLRFYSGYIIGAINMVLGILSSFQRFGKAAEKTELHASAALQYAMLYRSIETELSLNHERRTANFIMNVLQDMDRLLAQSPPIPQKIVDAFNDMYPMLSHKPDVCNGMGSPKSKSLNPSDMVRRLFSPASVDKFPESPTTRAEALTVNVEERPRDRVNFEITTT
jgi:hypothetical protein